MFQSRNRETFDFYSDNALDTREARQFQSRNRETFDFYASHSKRTASLYSMFQSRNRESFDFYFQKSHIHAYRS